MTTPRSPENPVAAIATEMKQKGMSTVKIMIALFEMDIALKKINTTSDAVGTAMAVDVRAAKLNSKLETVVKAELNDLNKSVNALQDNVARLSTSKTTAQIAQNYTAQLQPLINDLSKMTDEHAKLLESSQKFITTMRTAFKTLGEQILEASKKPDAKKQIEALAEQQRQLQKIAEKTFEGKEFGKLTDGIQMLQSDVQKAVIAAGIPAGTASTPTQKQ